MSAPRKPGARFGGKRKTPDERLREFASKVTVPPTSLLACAHAPRATGAIVTGTDPCTCGHAPEEHGRDPAYPGSTGCNGLAEGLRIGTLVACRCPAYEADPEEA